MRRTTALLICLAAGAFPASAQDAANGEQVFKKCRACHAAGPGAQNRVGPHLNGVVGRKAGSVSGFNYSEAMLEAGAKGTVWSEEALSTYLESPGDYIPKTRMAFAGIKDAAQRADLIAYLKTLQ